MSTLNTTPAKNTTDAQKRKYTKQATKLKSEMAEVEKQQKIDGFAKEIVTLFENGKKCRNSIVESKFDVILNILKIGKLLNIAKGELHTDDFEKLIEKINRSRRTIDRYMELTNDKRVVDITIENLRTMKKASLNKIKIMKGMNDDDFKEVLSGKDAKFKEMLKNQKDEKTKNLKNPYANISTKMFKSFKTQGLDYALKILDDEIGKYKSELSQLKSTAVNGAYNPTSKRKQKETA